jgi:hypothetical protein
VSEEENSMARLNTKGKVKLLRVNQRGDAFGSATDRITAEVILQLVGDDRRSFGFRMLDDGDLPVRRAYLDLLRDALNHGHIVNIDFDIAEGKTKGTIVRVWLTPAPPRPATVPRFANGEVARAG